MSKLQKNYDQTSINPRFDLIRLWIQDHIGQFIIFLLVSVYLMTGFTIGIALQKGLMVFGLVLSWVAGMGVAILAQMIRGSLVYFSQANPYRLNSNGHLIGGIAALILTVYASFEVVHLLSDQGVSQAVQVSIVGIIIGGFFLEMGFLNELVKINNAILVNDEELFEQAIASEEKLTEIKTRIGEARIALLHARRNRFTKALNATRGGQQMQEMDTADEPERQAPTDPLPQPRPQGTGVMPKRVLQAIARAKLNEEELQEILDMCEAGVTEDYLLKAVQMYTQKEPEASAPSTPSIPLEFSVNGNGKH